MRSLKFLVPFWGTIVALFLALVIYIGSPVCETSSIKMRTFYVSKPYLQSLIIMSNKECIQKIVACNHGKLLQQTWDQRKIGIHLKEPSPWSVEAAGNFVIETDGRILSFNQKVSGDKDSIFILSKLDKPVNEVKDHYTSIHIIRSGNDSVEISITNSLQVSRRTWFMFHDRVKNEVDNIAQNELNGIVETIKTELSKPPIIKLDIPRRK